MGSGTAREKRDPRIVARQGGQIRLARLVAPDARDLNGEFTAHRCGVSVFAATFELVAWAAVGHGSAAKGAETAVRRAHRHGRQAALTTDGLHAAVRAR